LFKSESFNYDVHKKGKLLGIFGERGMGRGVRSRQSERRREGRGERKMGSNEAAW
jgi:hypothetical protein